MQAVKDALHMLENGASIPAARSVCPPNILYNLVKWKVHGTLILAVLHKFCFTTIVLHIYSFIRWYYSFIRWYAYTILVVCQVLALNFLD